MTDGLEFNPPPGWPVPPAGWTPPAGWEPDPSWPAPPPSWSFWVPATTTDTVDVEPTAAPPAADLVDTSVVAEREFTLEREARRAAEHEVQVLNEVLAATRSALDQARTQAAAATATDVRPDLVNLDDERVLQEVGIYRYHHPLENSEEFRDRLRQLQERIKEAVKQGEAIEASDLFTFNNSLAKGRKMTSDLSKLMLRAYNAEADNCVRSLRAGNVVTAKKRLESSVTSIAKLGSMMEMRISPEYHSMRIEEIGVTADFLMKVQEEREQAREERERLREERKVEQELAAERERLDKERAHFLKALESLRASGDVAGAADLEHKLVELEAAITQNEVRAANIRAGYVYVISNRGAFGPNMVKIGLTRRLEPLDRVRELGDASVPFPFDVHALYFSEDAVGLENELHHAFADQRVNRVNERREFFFTTPQQVRQVLAEKVGNLLEFTDEPEATQYLQSRKYWLSS